MRNKVEVALCFLDNLEEVMIDEEKALKESSSSGALRMFIEQSHDEVYGCLKGGSGNSGGKRLAISVVEEAWLSEKEEV
nr:hypothetical protein [Tanacetum cinerariifolium]